jgi:D-alanine--poly(phosphoribitol) ligase subunit 2
LRRAGFRTNARWLPRDLDDLDDGHLVFIYKRLISTVMTPANVIADRVLEAVAEVAQVPDVADLRANLDINLYETHLLDSLRTVELLLLLSDRLNVDLSPAELDREQWATPRKLIGYLEQRSSH